MSLSRLFTVIVAVIAGALAIAFPSALGWLVGTYAYSAATLAAPIFLGYLLRKRFLLRPYAALGSMIAGIAGCATAQLIGTTVP